MDAAPMRYIAHAGLARHRDGGTPTGESLERALALGVDAVELDVCVTADGVAVLRHDREVAPRVPVNALSYRMLRHLVPETMTVAQGLDTIGDGADVLLDVKMAEAAPVLGRLLRRRGGAGNVAVCTPFGDALLTMRAIVPRVPRWLAFPDVGDNARQGTRSVLGTLVTRRSRGMATGIAAGLGRAVVAARQGPAEALARVCAIPWRPWLADEIVALARSVDASGVCLHHYTLTPGVVAACHNAGLPVAAFTVNRRAEAGRALAAGVDLITTDRVQLVRQAIAQLTLGLNPALVPQA